MRSLYFFPLTALFMIGFFFFLLFLFVFVQVGLLSYAYERIGISATAVFPLLLCALFGSVINIPVTRTRSGPIVARQVVQFFGAHYVVPVSEEQGTPVIAVTVGGALIPPLLSLSLLLTTGLFFRGVLGIVIAAAIGLLLAPEQAPALAYIVGTMGCLIGADLLNLHRLAGWGPQLPRSAVPVRLMAFS